MKTWVVLAILVAASWDFVASNKNPINRPSVRKPPPSVFGGGSDWPGFPSGRSFWFRRKRSVSDVMDPVEHKDENREKRSPQFPLPPWEFFQFNGQPIGFQQNGFGGEPRMIRGYTKPRWKHGNYRGVYPIYN